MPVNHESHTDRKEMSVNERVQELNTRCDVRSRALTAVADTLELMRCPTLARMLRDGLVKPITQLEASRVILDPHARFDVLSQALVMLNEAFREVHDIPRVCKALEDLDNQLNETDPEFSTKQKEIHQKLADLRQPSIEYAYYIGDEKNFTQLLDDAVQRTLRSNS